MANNSVSNLKKLGVLFLAGIMLSGCAVNSNNLQGITAHAKSRKTRVYHSKKYRKSHKKSKYGTRRKDKKSKRVKTANKAEQNRKFRELSEKLRHASRSNKTTKALLNKIKSDQNGAKLSGNQSLQLIQQQADQLNQKENDLKKQYSTVFRDWQNSNGHFKRRTNDRKELNKIQQQINKTEGQIDYLYRQSRAILGNMAEMKKHYKEEKYDRSIMGNVEDTYPISHPSYVRISAPTHFYNYWDVSKAQYRSFAVRPNMPKSNPVHKVYAAQQVILTDKTAYNMYQIGSNMSTANDRYWILADATTAAHKPERHFHLYQQKGYGIYGLISSATPMYDSMTRDADMIGYVQAGQHLNVLARYEDPHYGLIGYQVRKATSHHKSYGKTFYIPSSNSIYIYE